MEPEEIDRIAAWLVLRGLEGVSETQMVDGFCTRCVAAGMPLRRAVAIIDTLHPVYEGRAFRWRYEQAEEQSVLEYGRTDGGEAAESWRRSTFHHLLESGATERRWRLDGSEATAMSQLRLARDEGQSDYVCFAHRFAEEGTIGEMDCVYSSWTTDRPDGFSSEELAALRRLVPILALAIKSVALGHLAGTLVEVYLGREAGRRVLKGRIARGKAERLEAVLWFSDLRGYTSITDTAEPSTIIPLLNDYGEAVITAIRHEGGDVLKLMGDGTLAMFSDGDSGEACGAALRAEARMREAVTALNERRADGGLPVTSVYLGLHVGEVLFGNIGSDERLDFTTVGPAVNETSRIASLCRSVERPVLVSSAFRDAIPEPERHRLVSVGRFALRGVGRAQDLYTLDPGLMRSAQTP